MEAKNETERTQDESIEKGGRNRKSRELPRLKHIQERLIREKTELMHWVGIIVVVQAVLSVFIFVLLPEYENITNRVLLGIGFIVSVFFSLAYYFAPLKKLRRFSYLPLIIISGVTVLFMFALPTIGYYYLFMVFLLSALHIRGIFKVSIIPYLVIVIMILMAFSVWLSGLELATGLVLGVALSISFVLFDFEFGLFAKHRQKSLIKMIKQERFINRAENVIKRDQLLLDTISDGMIMVDHNDIIDVYNKSAEKLLGWTRKEAVGRKLDEFLNFSPAFFTGEHRKKMIFGSLFIGPIKEFGMRIKNKNGKDIFADITLYPIVIDSIEGIKKRGFMFTLHDVTADVEEDKAKLDFVAMAAHELRAPIGSIIGYLSVVQDEIGDKIGSEYKEFLRRAYSSSKELAELIENILSITKIEKGQRPMNTEPLDWDSFLASKVAEFSPSAQSKGLALEWIPAEESVPPVLADRLLISEVVNNLVGNAIKYTDEGGVRVWAEYDEPKKVVVTHIQDSGHGIPEDSIKHLFERFYRVKTSLKKGIKGTGLGLYISKSMVEQHGGEIWVASEENKGTTFSFSIPTVNKDTPKN